jgi:hypothetical protein
MEEAERVLKSGNVWRTQNSLMKLKNFKDNVAWMGIMYCFNTLKEMKTHIMVQIGVGCDDITVDGVNRYNERDKFCADDSFIDIAHSIKLKTYKFNVYEYDIDKRKVFIGIYFKNSEVMYWLIHKYD